MGSINRIFLNAKLVEAMSSSVQEAVHRLPPQFQLTVSRFLRALQYIMGEPVPHPERLAHRFRTGDETGEGRAYYDVFRRELRRELAMGERSAYQPHISDIGRSDACWLYSFVRNRSPEIVVETGVSHGLSTWAILAALDDAGTGTLTSIDLPQRTDIPLSDYTPDLWTETAPAIPADRNPGWLVPDRHRDRWTLHEGRSQTVLPTVCNQFNELDLFVHDSQHDTSCMLFELETAWSHLASDGAIVVDDAETSDAVWRFLEERDVELLETSPDGMVVLGPAKTSYRR